MTGFRRVMSSVLARIDEEQLIRKAWERDWSVWGKTPDEISNRLGWLDLPRTMVEQVARLGEFAKTVREEGLKHVVLLGMGGSSLAPEVFAKTFGAAAGSADLIVLDSTVPDAVRAVDRAVGMTSTLFIVSSKSGTTIEPDVLMDYFWARLRSHGQVPGTRFVAITDPGTKLEELARERGFRATFINQPDLGGRYAALSLVGLVPAALLGMDVGELLARAGAMADACLPGAAAEHPAAALAAFLVAGARSGRDKVTGIAPDRISTFGLWLEQLVAESLGKGGKGLIPVVGEPLLAPEIYGEDRLFVQLALEGGSEVAAGGSKPPDDEDRLMEALADIGHPVLKLVLDDAYDLGAQIFLWELAVALAGAMIGVQPFDQPDVEEAKIEARRALDAYVADHVEPSVPPVGSPAALLADAQEGDYLAIMAFVARSDGTDAALADLRRAVSGRYGLATTLGYGPRFLHSTGQLHKGGPASIIALQIVDGGEELPVPGREYGFKILSHAQAAGDLATLEARGRRVARIDAGIDAAEAVRELTRGLVG
jgi:glucose-6-phosphate isomerase